MSMTFWIPNAPEKNVCEPCMCAQLAPSFLDDEPIWDELGSHANKDCVLCDGNGFFMRKETDGPSISMANTNCIDVLIMLNLPPDPCGEISPRAAPAVLRKAIMALNTKIAERFSREDFVDGRVIMCGTSTESIRRRISGLIDVLKYGVDHNQKVVWD